MLLLAWIAGAGAQQWVSCDLDRGAGDGLAECATVPLPLDPAVPDGPTFDVAVKRFPAPRQPARGQLWFVTGGPGDAGTDDIAALGAYDALGPDLDRYTFDARGTGESGRLSCPDQEDPSSFDGFEIVGDEWGPCMERVGVEYADVLPWITTTTTAHDLVALSDRFAEGEVYWWGLSYGTFLVERALHLAPDRPDTSCLLDMYGFDWDGDPFTNRQIWGTADGWGDGFVCATAGPSPRWLFLLLIPGLRRRR